MATKKRSGVNKSQFVRDQDTSLSAAEVVAAGKAKGIKLTPAFVYSIRSAAKAAKGSKGKAPKTVKVATLASGHGTGNGFEEMLREIVRDEIRSYFAKLA